MVSIIDYGMGNVASILNTPGNYFYISAMNPMHGIRFRHWVVSTSEGG